LLTVPASPNWPAVLLPQQSAWLAAAVAHVCDPTGEMLRIVNVRFTEMPTAVGRS
jgi:hypothetical protein